MKIYHKLICITVFIIPFIMNPQSSTFAGNDSNQAVSQSDFRVVKGSKFIIMGTSSLHDWEMVSENFEGTFTIDTDSPTLEIKNIALKVAVKSLVSGNKGMDKKCYGALMADKYPTISYNFKSVKSIKLVKSNTYEALLSGTLTIAGKTRPVDIVTTITVSGTKIHITGEKPLRMTDFGVEPPTALLGTIKTGNDITIQFNLNLL